MKSQARFIPLLLKALLFQMSSPHNATKSRVLYYNFSYFICSLFISPNRLSELSSIFPESSFSPGDFQDVPLFDNTRSPVEDNPENTVQGEQNIASAVNEHAGLFSCPVEGCVSTFQRSLRSWRDS